MNNNTVNTPRRRVGTVTMGFALILTGISILLAVFTSSINLLYVLKLSPIILILLGTELLIYYFRKPNENVKFDVFSTLFCGIIILISLTMGAALYCTSAFSITPERYIAFERFERSVSDSIKSTLFEDTNVKSVNVYSYSELYFDYNEANIKNFNSCGGRTSVIVELREIIGENAKEDFAKAAVGVLNKVYSVTDRVEEITIRDENGIFHFEHSGIKPESLSVENLSVKIYETGLEV